MSALASALATTFRALRERPLAPVDVAVLDSAIDSTHPDLASRVVEAYTLEEQDGATLARPRPIDQNVDTFGHGTAVGSIITGLAPNARLVDYQVLGGSNTGAGAAVLEALRCAIRRPCKVLNMSLAVTAPFAPKLMALCEEAYRAGIVVVAAKRNMPLVDFGFPAEFSSVVSVDTDRFESSMDLRYQFNHAIEYIGRGEEVQVAATGGGYTVKTGTSFATPAISGLCALLLGAFPDLRPFEIKAILKAHAREGHDGP